VRERQWLTRPCFEVTILQVSVIPVRNLTEVEVRKYLQTTELSRTQGPVSQLHYIHLRTSMFALRQSWVIAELLTLQYIPKQRNASALSVLMSEVVLEADSLKESA
jgi:hypothetical protein